MSATLWCDLTCWGWGYSLVPVPLFYQLIYIDHTYARRGTCTSTWKYIYIYVAPRRSYVFLGPSTQCIFVCFRRVFFRLGRRNGFWLVVLLGIRDDYLLIGPLLIIHHRSISIFLLVFSSYLCGSAESTKKERVNTHERTNERVVTERTMPQWWWLMMMSGLQVNLIKLVTTLFFFVMFVCCFFIAVVGVVGSSSRYTRVVMEEQEGGGERWRCVWWRAGVWAIVTAVCLLQ